MEMLFSIMILFFIFYFLFKLGIGLIKIFFALTGVLLFLVFLPIMIIPFVMIFGIGFIIFAFLKAIF